MSFLLIIPVLGGLSVGSVSAIETVYIKADGSIDPSSAPISTVDEVLYTFTDDVHYAIVVEKDGIVIDGAGYSLVGPGYGGWSGISLVDVSGVTVRNTTISGFDYGIYAYQSSAISLERNLIHSNADDGIFLIESQNCVLSENDLIGNTRNGVGFNLAHNNTLSGNNATGNSGSGFYIFASSDNTLTLNNASGNVAEGFLIDSGRGNTLSDNTALDNSCSCLIQSCSDTAVYDNDIRSALGTGLYITSSSSTTLSGNLISDSESGLKIELSPNTTLRDNSVVNARFGLGVFGDALWDFVNDIDTSNTVDGRPVHYLVGEDDIVMSPAAASEAGYLALVDCSRVTVERLGLHGNLQGVLLAYADNCTLANSTITHNWHGIELFGSSNNTISCNNVSGNSHEGIDVIASRNNTFSGNDVTGHMAQGFRLVGSAGNRFLDNFISVNDRGIDLYSSPETSIVMNRIEGNGYGVYSNTAWDNLIVENRISRNVNGVYLLSSVGNRIFHNDFLANIHQAVTEPLGYTSLDWDDGYPSGGNFWSDYSGADNMSGQLQDHPGSDGIGDTPYEVPSGVMDDYPLMSPFGPYILPVAMFTAEPANGSLTTLFEFDASSSSDPEGTPPPLEVRWDWEGDGVWDTDWSTDLVAHHTYPVNGTYYVTVQVRNADMMTNTSVTEVIVGDDGSSTSDPDGSSLLVPVLIALAVISSVLIGIYVARRFVFERG